MNEIQIDAEVLKLLKTKPMNLADVYHDLRKNAAFDTITRHQVRESFNRLEGKGHIKWTWGFFAES